MAHIAWFPFYIGDYLKDTQELSPVEHGMYLKLMLWYYNKAKPIPHAKRYAIAGANADANASGLLNGCDASGGDIYTLCDYLLEEFFVRDGNFWHHNRIDGEIEKRIKISESRSLAAKKSHQKDTKTSDAKAHASAMQVQTQSQSQSQGLSKLNPKGRATIPDWVDGELWADYLEHRQKLKKPMTSKAQQLAISQLERFFKDGENVRDVIEQSIQNGWAGLFTTKNKGHNNGTTNRRPSQTEIIAQQIADTK